MTYRERREGRAKRLHEWAEKREQKAAGSLERARELADMIPLGQPVLSGHHSEGRHRRDLGRIEGGYRAGFEHAARADEFKSRVANIEAQAARAIYSDDPDAVEALERRIAGLEAERDRIKAYNATCRKGAPDVSLLDALQAAHLEGIRSHCPYQLGKGGAYPADELANLSGDIGRNRRRLEHLLGQPSTMEGGDEEA